MTTESPTPAQHEEDTLTVREFEKRKAELWASKRVHEWPEILTPDGPGQVVVNLSVTECTYLGGRVEYWSSCGTTNMKCVAANGHEMCIDEIK
jgi:hypothetical protein